MKKQFDFEEELRKAKEEREERRLSDKIGLLPLEQAIISQLQAYGASRMEDIIASAPIAHLVEEELERLEGKGYLEESEGYYFIARKKKYK
jgi:hypothetical protein